MARYGDPKLAPKVVMSLHLPLELAEKMRAVADQQRLSYSEAARMAIAEWAERQPAEQLAASR
jgi:Arc/MetJ-type ribon-helix-helix transcriptional regulator